MRLLKNEKMTHALFALLFVVIITVFISPLILFVENNNISNIDSVKNLKDLVNYLGESSTIQNIQDSVWWTIVTLTTVGYGDFYPKTIPGRIISLFVMFIGIGILSIFYGSVAEIFLEKKLREEFGMATYQLRGCL